jgi:hypothetical protein
MFARTEIIDRVGLSIERRRAACGRRGDQKGGRSEEDEGEAFGS